MQRYRQPILLPSSAAVQRAAPAPMAPLRTSWPPNRRRSAAWCSGAGSAGKRHGAGSAERSSLAELDQGDVIITENPTFLGALIAFNPCESRYVGVAMDGDGMDMDALETVLRREPRAKLLYTVPDFQNPTGMTMSLPRRQQLIELADRFDLIILEDTPYRELRYEGGALPPLESLDAEGRVIFLGSFSKILAPGLRVGWAVASPEIIGQLGLLKLAADTQCSTLNMAAVSLFLDRYDVDAHIGTIWQHFPQEVSCTDPQGGMFTWLTFPGSFDAGRFMSEHALPQAKVAHVPGATFFPTVQEANHARVSYSSPPDEVIVRGMTALGELLKRTMRQEPALGAP